VYRAGAGGFPGSERLSEAGNGPHGSGLLSVQLHLPVCEHSADVDDSASAVDVR
jgi:hypothetical protein